MSFTAAKLAFSKATLLDDPQQDAPTRVMMGLSSLAVGAAPEQLIDSDWVSLALVSQKMKAAETGHRTSDRERLAVYETIRHFRYFEESQFHVMTDHKPLMYAFIGNHESYSTPETRHLAFISEYIANLRHVRNL